MMGIGPALRRVVHLLRRRRHEIDLDEEIETHRLLRQENLTRTGVPPADAANASRRALGNVALAREDARQMWGWPAAERAWQDGRVGIRILRQRPLFAAVVIATLGIGIGGSTAMFSLVDAVLLRQLPYREPERLARIWETKPSDGLDRHGVSDADAADWLARSRTIEGLALFGTSTTPTVIGVGDVPIQVRDASVTPNFLALIGVSPILGRDFSGAPERSGPLDRREVIVSHALWLRAFGGDPSVIGRTIRLEGVPAGLVVGVMPPGFSLPEGTELWTAMRPSTRQRDARDDGAIARLAPDASLARARADLQSIAERLAREYPETNAGWTIAIASLRDSIVGGHRLALVTLFAAVTCVVLVGCANVANLLLTRGLARRHELAVRAALGADRSRIVRLLLAETAAMASIGCAVGLVLAAALVPLAVSVAGADVPRLAAARLDASALIYSLLLTVATTLMAGLLPAVRLSRIDPRLGHDLAAERATPPGANIHAQRVIVAAELAICFVLLAGALLFARTLARLEGVDLGFDPNHVIGIDARIPFFRTLAPDRWQRAASDIDNVLDRLRAMPGVQAASTALDLPLDDNLVRTIVTRPGASREYSAVYHNVSPDYFRTMAMTLVQGRDFTRGDASTLARSPMSSSRTTAPRAGAVIVNEVAARMLWPSGDALGQSLSTSFDSSAIAGRRVVGVVRNVRSDDRRRDAPPEVYVPYLEDPSFATTLLVRTALPTDRIVPSIRRVLHDVSADLSLAHVRTLDEVVDRSARSTRFSAVMIGVFAGTSLLLAAIGVFGVFAFGVAARAREVGVRIALGATRADLLWMFLRQASAPIVAGLACGLAAAMALGRLVASLLYGVTPTDAISYGCAGLTLAAVSFVASYLPIRRALRRDPARALRA
jgi:putative ABC transport system permease protein